MRHRRRHLSGVASGNGQRVVAWLGALSLMVLAACADADGDESVYVLPAADTWEVVDAGTFEAGDALAEVSVPPFSWYSEYRRRADAEAGLIVLGGHTARFDEARRALERLHFGFAVADVPGWTAVVSTSSLDPASGIILLLDGGRHTFSVHSTEFLASDLAAFASTLRRVDQREWSDATGAKTGG